MAKISHQELIEKIQSLELLSLLYIIVEAKAGKHIDIVHEIPIPVIEQAETSLKTLINYSKTVVI